MLRVISCLAGLLLALPVLEAEESGETPDAARFGAYLATIEPLSVPAGVALDDEGRVLVCETLEHRVRVFAADGSPVGSFGSYGTGAAKLDRPRDLAIGDDGLVYVADTGNHRVQVFARDGRFVGSWSGRGTDPGRLLEPIGIDVGAGVVAVAESGNDRVTIFNKRGSLVRILGGEDGTLVEPGGVALDADGRCYVTDRGTGRVHVFAPDGTHERAFADFGPHPGLLAKAEGIALRDDRLYVADTDNHRVQVFTRSGEPLYSLGLHVVRPHEGEGRLHYPSHVAVSPSGDRLVVVESFEDRAQIFGPGSDEEAARQFPGAERTTHLGAHAAAHRDLLVVSELDRGAILVYDLTLGEPVKVTDFASVGTLPGQIVEPAGLALLPERQRILVTDAVLGRLSVFELDRDPGGRLRFDPAMARFVKLADFEALARSGGPRILEPGAIAVEESGDLLVADRLGGRVHRFSPALAPLGSFGGYGTGEGELRRPAAIAIAPEHRLIYVADAGNHRVQAFDPRGSARFAVEAGHDGERFVDLAAILFTRDRLFVVDRGAHRVHVLDPRGKAIRAFGRRGLGPGEFVKPCAITEDGKGRLWIVDLGNHRAQAFTPAGRFLDAFGARLYVQEALAPARAKRDREQREEEQR